MAKPLPIMCYVCFQEGDKLIMQKKVFQKTKQTDEYRVLMYTATATTDIPKCEQVGGRTITNREKVADANEKVFFIRWFDKVFIKGEKRNLVFKKKFNDIRNKISEPIFEEQKVVVYDGKINIDDSIVGIKLGTRSRRDTPFILWFEKKSVVVEHVNSNNGANVRRIDILQDTNASPQHQENNQQQPQEKPRTNINQTQKAANLPNQQPQNIPGIQETQNYHSYTPNIYSLQSYVESQKASYGLPQNCEICFELPPNLFNSAPQQRSNIWNGAGAQWLPNNHIYYFSSPGIDAIQSNINDGGAYGNGATGLYKTAAYQVSPQEGIFSQQPLYENINTNLVDSRAVYCDIKRYENEAVVNVEEPNEGKLGLN